MKLAVLYSGGKDSNFAMYQMAKQGHEILCLLTIEPKDAGSMLFHYPNISWTHLQSQSLGIPQLTRSSDGEDELALLQDIVYEAKRKYSIEGVVTGGIKSHYQKERFHDVFRKGGLVGVDPLWAIDEESYLRELPRNHFKVTVTRVAALGLGTKWLGIQLDDAKVEELVLLSRKYHFNPSLEGGEGETFVTDMPMFKKEILILEAEAIWSRDEGILNIKKAILRDKLQHV